MKASKFSDAQKAFTLKQGDDGVPVAEICRTGDTRQAIPFFRRARRLSPVSSPKQALKSPHSRQLGAVQSESLHTPAPPALSRDKACRLAAVKQKGHRSKVTVIKQEMGIPAAAGPAPRKPFASRQDRLKGQPQEV